MNLKSLRFLVVAVAAAMSLTALAAVLAQQLIPTGTETAASSLLSRNALAQTAPKAKNVVLMHGLFADGSSWSEVIARLQAAGLNVTSVQNPLTTLPEAVDAALRVLGRQNGPTVLAGHSFSRMIVTEAGVHPNVSALVYVAARAPDAGEDYAALAKQFPTPPASAGIVFDGDEGRLSEEAFLRDFIAGT
jgi:pimeloyl-ACP methyl ester carboxylesterase